MMAEKPEKAVYLAVKGMLPKNKLGSAMLKMLRVYPGADYANAAQKPETLVITGHVYDEK